MHVAFWQAGPEASSLRDSHSFLSSVVLAMGNLGSEQIVSHLERALDHSNLNVVSAARRSLGETKHVQSEFALLRHFHNTSRVDIRSRAATLRALSKHNCSYQTASSILSGGLKMIGQDFLRNNETCHSRCASRCSIRGTVKCSNFCTHRCSTLMHFKSELGNFVHSLRNSGNLLRLVAEALSAGHVDALANLGILPDLDPEPLSLSIGHKSTNWEQTFGSSIIGSSTTVDLENGMRLWINSFERSMEALIDNTASAHVRAWIRSATIFEAGIELEASFSSFQSTAPDLRTTLTEWSKQRYPGALDHLAKAIFNVVAILRGMDGTDLLFPLVHPNGSRGHLALIELCNASNQISTARSSFQSAALEMQSIGSFNASAERLRQLQKFLREDSDRVIDVLNSAQDVLQDHRPHLLNVSKFLHSQMLHFRNQFQNNTKSLQERVSLQSPDFTERLLNLSNSLGLDTDIPVLTKELSILNTFRRRSSILIKSRYWGASVQDSFLEPMANDLYTRHLKPSLWTGTCLLNWTLRAYNTFQKDIDILANVSNDQCNSMGLLTLDQLQCCSQAVECYASCFFSKRTCDTRFEECIDGVLSEDFRGKDVLTVMPSWKIFSKIRRFFCVCQRDPVRPSLSGDCPRFFSKTGSRECLSFSASMDINHTSDQNWVTAANDLLGSIITDDVSSSQIRTSLSDFVRPATENTSERDIESFSRWLNVSQTLSKYLKESLHRERSTGRLLSFGGSRIPRPSQGGIHNVDSFFEASMSLSLWDTSSSLDLFEESLSLLQTVLSGMRETARDPKADKVVKMRRLLAGALEEEAVTLESARRIKDFVFDVIAIQRMSRGVKLEAFKLAGRMAGDQRSRFVSALSGVKKSDLENIVSLATILKQREQLLSQLQANLSSSGLDAFPAFFPSPDMISFRTRGDPSLVNFLAFPRQPNQVELNITHRT